MNTAVAETTQERVYQLGDTDIPEELTTLIKKVLTKHIENTTNPHFTKLLNLLWERCMTLCPDEETKDDGTLWDQVNLDTFMPRLPNNLTFVCLDTERYDYNGSFSLAHFLWHCLGSCGGPKARYVSLSIPKAHSNSFKFHPENLRRIRVNLSRLRMYA